MYAAHSSDYNLDIHTSNWMHHRRNSVSHSQTLFTLVTQPYAGIFFAIVTTIGYFYLYHCTGIILSTTLYSTNPFHRTIVYYLHHHI